ncbi:MAG: beta-galactosidase [Clostridia bacterium]|nr:beta-galactosidase [Clostridia bacterium]
MTFTVNEKDYLLDGKPFKLLSGSMHYFRIPREYWYDRLLKLKECGLNTVETYVAWNFHEKKEGEFCFTGMADLGAFLDTASELGLYAIVRPGPFICAEWEAGGLPAWLLNVPGLRIRRDNAPFLEKVENFFAKLFEIIVPRLCTKGGNILMLQVENEYGSFGNDKVYLKKMEDLFRRLGADCLLFRADGPNPDMMAYADTGIFTTNTFGSQPAKWQENYYALGYKGPFTCMEYWCGWFDHWYEDHHARDPKNVAEEIRTFLDRSAHFNFYMFHGGTNFGFMSGANELPGPYAPTTTAYDYDGLVSEAGDRTEKYYLVRDAIAEKYGAPALTAKETEKKAYGEIKLTSTAELFDCVDVLCPKKFHAPDPLTMEETETYYGYSLYETTLTSPHGTVLTPEPLADRVQVFLDGEPVGVMEREQKETPIELPAAPDGTVRKLTLLCENMGRINYGPHILDRKGLSAVRLGNAYHFGWETCPLPMESFEGIPFGSFHTTSRPAFHKGNLQIQGTPCDTFLSTRGLHKGFVVVNGVNIGRYYTDAGPQYALYIPAPFLKEGDNEILVFESEATETDTLTFRDAPDYTK